MPEYELVTILSPILSQEEVTNTTDRLNGIITSDGGTVTHQERWGTRRLAYPIRKAGNRFLEGNYYLTRFEAEGSHTRQIENHLRLSENVIRHLLVRAEVPIAASPRPTEPPPRGEAPAAPAPAAVADAPATEAPVQDAQAPEAQVADAQAPDAPVDEAPAVDAAPAVAEAPAEEAETTEATEDDAPADDVPCG